MSDHHDSDCPTDDLEWHGDGEAPAIGAGIRYAQPVDIGVLGLLKPGQRSSRRHRQRIPPIIPRQPAPDQQAVVSNASSNVPSGLIWLCDRPQRTRPSKVSDWPGARATR